MNKNVNFMLVQHINKLTDSPIETGKVTPDGFKFNVGNFFISQEPNGLQLQRVVTPGGGVTLPLGNQGMTAKQLEIQLRAFMAGIEIMKGIR